MFLQEESMPEDLRPSKSHVIFWVSEDGEMMFASVDPNYSDAYKKGEVRNLLKEMLKVPNHKIGIIIGKERFPLVSELELDYNPLTILS